MKKFIILSITIVSIFSLSVIYHIIDLQENELVNYEDIYDVVELPLTVDQIPLSYQIEEIDGNKVLKVSYTNHTSEEILNLLVHLKVKDSLDPIIINIPHSLQQGETSSASQVNVSEDIQVEDITAIKYMISLTRGIYVEYDAITNQYNWS